MTASAATVAAPTVAGCGASLASCTITAVKPASSRIRASAAAFAAMTDTGVPS